MLKQGCLRVLELDVHTIRCASSQLGLDGFYKSLQCSAYAKPQQAVAYVQPMLCIVTKHVVAHIQ